MWTEMAKRGHESPRRASALEISREFNGYPTKSGKGSRSRIGIFLGVSWGNVRESVG